jgi:hypothetical protein
MTRNCFQIFLTEPQTEVVQEVARAAGQTVQEWLQDCVILMLRSNTDLYFGSSNTISEELNRKLELKEAV